MVNVIILNGAGSAGKSSIARAFQDMAIVPFMHVQMDAFLAMMPDRYWNDQEGVMFRQATVDGHAQVSIGIGSVATKLLEGMLGAMAAMASAGNNLIIDDVILSSNVAQDYRKRFKSQNLKFVGIHCPLEVLEERERLRGDREIGLARWQHERVHCNIRYDLEIQTGDRTPQQCAEDILKAFGLGIRA